ncbi:GntR family transcriptional regulator [Mycoplasmatota bacterium]|nr:GntR family transcriptional regulator [Mycoplasmatota bacterium]
MSIDYRDAIIIDRRSNKPIYEQIYAQLEDILSSARFINEERLATASHLAKLLNVDMSEVEKTYDLLEKRKFISYDEENFPYVTKYSRILDFFSKLVFIEDGIRSLGKTPSKETIDFEILEIDESDVIPLENYDDHRFLRQTRIFRADDEPYFFLEELYPIERFPKLLDVHRDLAGTLYENVLKKEYGIRFVKNNRQINVSSFDQKLSNILKVKEGLKGFKINLEYLDQNGNAFGYGHAYSLPHFYFEYDVKL